MVEAAPPPEVLPRSESPLPSGPMVSRMDSLTRRRMKETSAGDNVLIILDMVASSVEGKSSGSSRWGERVVNKYSQWGSMTPPFWGRGGANDEEEVGGGGGGTVECEDENSSS